MRSAADCFSRSSRERAHELSIQGHALGAWGPPKLCLPAAARSPPAEHGRRHRLHESAGHGRGFDKNGEVPDALLGLGFGFTEIGTVTPAPANPAIRAPGCIRLEDDRAVINRLGFKQ